MFEDLPGLAVLLAFIALCPAAIVWWRGRTLVRHADDPAFPERWEAARRRNGSTTVLAVAVLIVASPGSVEWTLPLLAVSYVVASYPLRKALYAETWTLGGYLSFVGRISAVVWGFWLLLALLPTLVRLAGVYDRIVAVAATTLLLIWNTQSDRVLRRVLRTRPVTDAALLNRFSAVAQRSRVIEPRFEWIPLNGGVISNALALPSASGNPSIRSSVLFTETLLAQMDRDEATAICAHEIAHLEHYTPRLMRQYKYVNAMLVVTGAFLGLVPRLAGWQSSIFASVLWLVALVGIMTWRVRNRQKNETASDLRGVELCGDSEALIRGLNKFYTTARMPRRLAVDVERHATHPSVARRIRDIRAAAGAPPAALGEPASFTAADGRSTVTFVADRLQWTEGNVASHSLVYSQFSELRLQVMARGGTSLLAVERSGRKWHVAIPTADVERLQAVLDVVDGQLGEPPGPPSHVAFARMTRVTAAFAAAFAVTLGQLAMAVAAVIAVLLPRAPLFAGAGAAAIATAFVTARLYAHVGFDGRIGTAAMLTVVGSLLLAGAYSRRHDEIAPRTMIGVAVLGLCTVFWCGLLIMHGLHPVKLHLSAVAVPSAAVLLFASSTTLACLRTRWLRYAAAPIGLAGMVALMAGSPWFLDLFGRDPFLGPAQPFTWRTVSGSLQGEIRAPFFASTVHVSPSARAVIVSAIDEEDETATARFHIGRPGGPLVPNDADDLVFIDDDHVLGLYDGSDDRLEIRASTVDAPGAVIWRHSVPALWSSALTYRPAGRRWRLRGMSEDGNLVQLEGQLGSHDVSEMRWAGLGRGTLPIMTAVSGSTALVVQTEYSPSPFQRGGWWRLALLFPGGQAQSRFSLMNAGKQAEVPITRFVSNCFNASADTDGLLCSVFDGTRTRFAAIDPETARITPVAWLDGQFTGTVMSPAGWLSGWSRSQAVAVRPITREAIRLTPADGMERVTYVTVTDHTFTTLSYNENGSTVRVYTLQEEPFRIANH